MKAFNLEMARTFGFVLDCGSFCCWSGLSQELEKTQKMFCVSVGVFIVK